MLSIAQPRSPRPCLGLPSIGPPQPAHPASNPWASLPQYAQNLAGGGTLFIGEVGGKSNGTAEIGAPCRAPAVAMEITAKTAIAMGIKPSKPNPLRNAAPAMIRATPTKSAMKNMEAHPIGALLVPAYGARVDNVPLRGGTEAILPSIIAGTT